MSRPGGCTSCLRGWPRSPPLGRVSAVSTQSARTSRRTPFPALLPPPPTIPGSIPKDELVGIPGQCSPLLGHVLLVQGAGRWYEEGLTFQSPHHQLAERNFGLLWGRGWALQSMGLCPLVFSTVCMCFALSWQNTKVKYILPFFSPTGLLCFLVLMCSSFSVL